VSHSSVVPILHFSTRSLCKKDAQAPREYWSHSEIENPTRALAEQPDHGGIVASGACTASRMLLPLKSAMNSRRLVCRESSIVRLDAIHAIAGGNDNDMVTMSTIKAMKFSNFPQTCGGPIEIAVISSDRRFRWCQRRRRRRRPGPSCRTLDSMSGSESLSRTASPRPGRTDWPARGRTAGIRSR
jgi:hypothetical protein